MQILYSKLGKYFEAIAAASGVDTKKEVTFLKSIFDEYCVHSVLDIACGTGRHSIALAKEGYTVTGIDYSEELLNIAETRKKGLPVEFLLQDVAEMRLDKDVDAAICMWSTFGELPYGQMLEGLRAILKPNGLFIVDSSYFSEIPTGTVNKTNEITVDGVRIQTDITDIYQGKTRLREVVHIVGGETIKDRSEMDILTERDYTELLNDFGFRHIKNYYDYSSKKQTQTKRIQLLFRLGSEFV